MKVINVTGEVVVIENADVPSTEIAESAAAERAEEIAVEAVVDAAVNANEAENAAEDAEEAALNADSAASVASSSAEAAFIAADVAQASAEVAARTLDEVFAAVESIPDRVALAMAAAANVVTEEPTIDEVVTESLEPEVSPRGEHFWFKGKGRLFGRSYDNA